jgi:hypothetical protein
MKTFIQTVDGETITLRFKTFSDTAVARNLNECQYELGKISRRLNKLCNERDLVLSKVAAVEKEQKYVQKRLATFSGNEFKKWLEEQKREMAQQQDEEVLAYAKADDFLLRNIGKPAYERLFKKGELNFRADGGKIFKLTQFGQLSQKRKDGDFQPVCVIRPKLPIPEQIAAVLTTLREEPKRILRG